MIFYQPMDLHSSMPHSVSSVHLCRYFQPLQKALLHSFKNRIKTTSFHPSWTLTCRKRFSETKTSCALGSIVPTFISGPGSVAMFFLRKVLQNRWFHPNPCQRNTLMIDTPLIISLTTNPWMNALISSWYHLFQIQVFLKFWSFQIFRP